MRTITITRPDDWHLHLRDGDHLRAVLPDTARRFARAIVMPNLKPPVTTTRLALEYGDRVLPAPPGGGAVGAVEDALPDRRHAARVNRRRARERARARGQVLPGGRHHAFG